jgi:probable phosphoglycerate mutase
MHSTVTKPFGKSDMTRVIFVRHGQSTFNAEKRFQGSCDDSVLTEKGHQDAYQTGAALRGTVLHAVYVSPLQRAKATANALLRGIEVDTEMQPVVEYWTELREIDLPNWQGLPYQYVRENFAEDYRCWKQQPHQFQMSAAHHAELGRGVAIATQTIYPLLELHDRVRQFWRKILPRHAGQTIAIVSHGGTIRALLNEALGISVEQFHALQQSNCGVSELLVSPVDHSTTLKQLNNTIHLREILPKLKEGKQGLRLLLIAAEPGESGHFLSHQLQSAEIDFCIHADTPNSKVIAGEILQHHPISVQLQVSRQDFAEVWQQQILSGQTTERSLLQHRPTTGLVIASTEVIRQMVAQVMGLSRQQWNCLAIAPNGLSVIHYPLMSKTPVLQAFNFGSNPSSNGSFIR